MDGIKIGNVEYRPEFNEEIVLWFPNPHYHAQERLKNEGYTLNPDGSMTKDICTINKTCFENEFSCYVVAFIEWNNAHDEFDVRSCGTRAFDLDRNDYENFREILELIGKHINREH